MPAKSKAQFRLFQAARHGDVPGISPEVASEFVGHESPAGLPEKKGRPSKKGKTSKKGKMPPATRPDGSKRKGW